MITIAKPKPGMFKPFSAAYISLVDDNITIDALQSEFEDLKAFFRYRKINGSTAMRKANGR